MVPRPKTVGREVMSSQSQRIMITIRVENEIYRRFHDEATRRGAAKNKLIVMLLRNFVDGTCVCIDKRVGSRPTKG